jgi:hypothetical protein
MELAFRDFGNMISVNKFLNTFKNMMYTLSTVETLDMHTHSIRVWYWK